LVEKYAPSRTAELREWSQAVERTLDPQVKMYQEMQKITQNGTVDEMMALASKYPPSFGPALSECGLEGRHRWRFGQGKRDCRDDSRSGAAPANVGSVGKSNGQRRGR
jgi:hypothetical protein